VPSALLDKLRQGKVLVRNWHALAWDSEEQIKKRRSVDKRGVKSDEAYTREVLGEMANARNLLVINDEAHHAWRVNWEAEGKYCAAGPEGQRRGSHGLDRRPGPAAPLARHPDLLRLLRHALHPVGQEEQRGGAVRLDRQRLRPERRHRVGLVKTPRVVVRDDAVPDAKTYKSRLYHIYNDPDVKDDLNRKARPEEPLPDLVLNAYYLLGYDWREAWKAGAKPGHPTPPVMITVCNRTETAARVKHAFDTRRIHIDELCDPERILHIDSKVLKRPKSRRNRGIAGWMGDDGDETKKTEPRPSAS
jgi:type III restriction enzyme